MNRAERRRLAKQGHIVPAEPVVNVKASSLETIREQIRREETIKAAENAFFYMLAVPTMVIHDKFAQLIKLKVDDKTREERFVEMCLEQFDYVHKEYVSIDDLHECLKKEAGVELVGFIR